MMPQMIHERMINDTQRLRIVGLSHARLPNIRSHATNKIGAIYRVLENYYHVCGFVSTSLPKPIEYLNRLMTFHLDQEVWRHRAALSLYAFEQRSKVAERQLQALDGQFDIIFQQRGLSLPGMVHDRCPYILHLDNTYLLSEAHYPVWAPLRGEKRQRWITLEHQLYQHATFLFAMTRTVRESLINQYGCDPARVVCIGAGVNLVAPSIIHRSYDQQIALFVGNDFKRKGGHLLLQAWQQVVKQFPKAELWIVGPRQHPRELPPNVRWFGRVNDRAALSRMYSAASVFVMPSLFEPWGNVYYEAMGHGIPVIATNSCSLPDLIHDGVTGRILPVGQVQPIVDAIGSFFHEPQMLAEMGARAYADIMRTRTWELVVQQMVPYFNAAAKR